MRTDKTEATFDPNDIRLNDDGDAAQITDNYVRTFADKIAVVAIWGLLGAIALAFSCFALQDAVVVIAWDNRASGWTVFAYAFGAIFAAVIACYTFRAMNGFRLHDAQYVAETPSSLMKATSMFLGFVAFIAILFVPIGYFYWEGIKYADYSPPVIWAKIDLGGWQFDPAHSFPRVSGWFITEYYSSDNYNRGIHYGPYPDKKSCAADEAAGENNGDFAAIGDCVLIYGVPEADAPGTYAGQQTQQQQEQQNQGQ